MISEARSRRALQREDDRLALEAWAERRGARLASEPEEVRAEMLSEARARLERDGCITWDPRVAEHCRMRVLSRLRLKRYGAIPDGAEWQRQIEAVREALGLDRREPP